MISRSNPNYRYDFDLFVSFISTEVNARSDRLDQLASAKDRKVAQLLSERNNDKNGPTQDKIPDSERYEGKPSRVVDGMMVYGVKYPWYRFKKMNPNQRKAVVELKRQAYKNRGKSNNTSTIKALEAVQKDMTSLEDRLVAGMTRGSNEPGDDTISTSSSSAASSGTKRSPYNMAQDDSLSLFIRDEL
jgi:hypothetical protein